MRGPSKLPPRHVMEAEVEDAAAGEHGLPTSLLDGYLTALVDVAVRGRRAT